MFIFVLRSKFEKKLSSFEFKFTPTAWPKVPAQALCRTQRPNLIPRTRRQSKILLNLKVAFSVVNHILDDWSSTSKHLAVSSSSKEETTAQWSAVRISSRTIQSRWSLKNNASSRQANDLDDSRYALKTPSSAYTFLPIRAFKLDKDATLFM